MAQSVISPKGRGDGPGGDPVARAKSDIVFCIDVSGSMTPCIDGVKQNIQDFIAKIENEPGVSIDWRLGFLGHQSGHGEDMTFFIREFATDVGAFRNALSGLGVSNSEANLPALDWCLDFPWRADAHKFIILFTDEDVDGGWEPEKSRARLGDLKAKIKAAGASVNIVSFLDQPSFHDYKEIASVDKCVAISVPGHDGFQTAQFPDLMAKLAKKISTGSRGAVNKQRPVEKDLYKVQPFVRIVKK